MNRVVPVLLLFMAAVIIGASVGFAARANAEPVADYTALNAGRVCATLDEHPTISAVVPLLQAVIGDSGFTVEQAAEVVVDSVVEVCPWHMPLLRRFVEANKPAAPVVLR